MRKLLRLLYQPYKYLVLVPVAFITMMFLGLLAISCSLFMDPKWIGRIFGATWSRIVVVFTPVFVKVTRKGKTPRKQSYVIVANHLSTYDTFLINGFIRKDIKWVMKKELKKIPGLNFGSRAIGHIFIDRSSAKAALKSIEEAKNVLTDGICFVFFPEGSRSTTGTTAKFKRGAFKTAFELNLPILPVTINGTDKIMPTNSFDIFPGKVEMVIHDPIELNGYTYENVELLMERVRDTIISAYH
jgi:1-acyl-sn-glycerol-3-phosphate acyltransferase